MVFPPMLFITFAVGLIYKAQKVALGLKQVPTSHAPLSAGEEAKLKKSWHIIKINRWMAVIQNQQNKASI